MTERRIADERIAALEEGFKRHEAGCDKRQGLILSRLESISDDVDTYKTTLKTLVGVVTVAIFFLQYFKEIILAWLK